MSRSGWGWGPRPRRRRKDGGIVARTRRGPFGATWWSRGFIAWLHDTGDAGRLARGRSYARSGQVFDLELRPGIVRAKVQGSRYRPYAVTIECEPIPAERWRAVAADMAQTSRLAAAVFAGRLPEQLETLLDEHGSTLLPRVGGDLQTACTCLDWIEPCKHVAAVCCILAERFDDDPFALLHWRGVDRETLLDALRAAAPLRRSRRTAGSRRVAREGEPLPDDAVTFWAGPAPEALVDAVTDDAPADPAALLQQLGPSEIEIDGQDLQQRLVAIYHAIGRESNSGDGA